MHIPHKAQKQNLATSLMVGALLLLWRGKGAGEEHMKEGSLKAQEKVIPWAARSARREENQHG